MQRCTEARARNNREIDRGGSAFIIAVESTVHRRFPRRAQRSHLGTPAWALPLRHSHLGTPGWFGFGGRPSRSCKQTNKRTDKTKQPTHTNSTRSGGPRVRSWSAVGSDAMRRELCRRLFDCLFVVRGFVFVRECVFSCGKECVWGRGARECVCVRPCAPACARACV